MGEEINIGNDTEWFTWDLFFDPDEDESAAVLNYRKVFGQEVITENVEFLAHKVPGHVTAYFLESFDPDQQNRIVFEYQGHYVTIVESALNTAFKRYPDFGIYQDEE